jgi:hypothetical protein
MSIILHILAGIGGVALLVVLAMAILTWATRDVAVPWGYAEPKYFGTPIVSFDLWRREFNQNLEPMGGNLYRRHVHRAYTGQLWQCAHGWTCGNDGEPTNPNLKYPRWMICKCCALDDPGAYVTWRFHLGETRPAANKIGRA